MQMTTRHKKLELTWSVKKKKIQCTASATETENWGKSI